jgi:hypothetical protein
MNGIGGSKEEYVRVYILNDLFYSAQHSIFADPGQ